MKRTKWGYTQFTLTHTPCLPQNGDNEMGTHPIYPDCYPWLRQMPTTTVDKEIQSAAFTSVAAALAKLVAGIPLAAWGFWPTSGVLEFDRSSIRPSWRSVDSFAPPDMDRDEYRWLE